MDRGNFGSSLSGVLHFGERQHMRAWNDAMLQPKPAPRKAIQTESRWTISPRNEA